MENLTQISSVSRLVALLLLVFSLQSQAVVQSPDLTDITRGTLLSQNEDGEIRDITLIRTDVEIDITGPIARTQVTQRFQNPSDTWTEALYLFPLPNDSAVDRMRMFVGDRIIEGQIRERDAARATYDRAKAEGKQAALVEQDRPNIFHTSVANIPPKGEVTVMIEFQQTIAWRDGEFSLRFPLAITPRYNGQLPPPEYVIEGQSSLTGGWSLLPGERPQALDITRDAHEANRVTLQTTLRPGFELNRVDSLYHDVTQSTKTDGAIQLTLAHEDVPADRDFVLTWSPVETAVPTAAFFSETTEEGAFGLLMLAPPTIDNWQPPAREVIFVIDTSGSMGGVSIRAAREALLAGVSGLSARDTFNIIEFNSDATQLFAQAQPATRQSRQQARAFVTSLEAQGGTEMRPALDLAFRTGNSDGQHLRQIIFITDGSVSDETSLFTHIHQHLGSSRLYTVGIGSAPNSYFMEEAAITGRGTYTYIASPDEAEAAIKALFDKLAAPALTDIEVSGSGMSEITPNPIPDLYVGEPLAIAMKLDPGLKQVNISGRIGNTLWTQTLEVESVDQHAGIGVDWARKMITQWQRAETRGEPRDLIKDQITQLALDFHLVSPFTSLVAVDVTPARPDSEGLNQHVVPPQRPHGLEIRLAQSATGYQLTLLAGLVLMILAGLIQLRLRTTSTRREALA